MEISLIIYGCHHGYASSKPRHAISKFVLSNHIFTQSLMAVIIAEQQKSPQVLFQKITIEAGFV